MKSYMYLAGLFIAVNATAQSPTDMRFVPKGNICAAVSYGYSSWNKYWQGEDLIENGNVGDVSRQQIGLGFNLGIHDRINFIAMLPYVMTNVSQGTLNGQSGISDISLDVKGKYADVELGPGKLHIGGDIGFSTPVGNYLIDFSPLNIGNGTTNLSYRQMFKYKLDKGFYADLKGNYTWRSNIPSIYREFYFDEGEAYYTNEVDVHNIFDWALAVGYSKPKYMVEAGFTSINTLGGGDIRTWDPGFPTNNVDASSVYGRFDYFLTEGKGFNFSLIGGYTVAGRNTGQPWFANLSLNYLFPVWGKSSGEEE